MLKDDEMLAHLHSLNLSSDAVAYVMAVRARPPARRVRSGTVRNSVIRFASTRMSRTIQAESHTVEGAFILDCEYGIDGVLEYWDQPSSVPIEGTRRDGRAYRSLYTPDFLVIKNKQVRVHEIKTENELKRLVLERPVDWKVENDSYKYRPAFEVYESLGLIHEVISSNSLNQLRADNIRLLIRARDTKQDNHNRSLTTKIASIVKDRLIIRLDQLQQELHLEDLTLVLQMIIKGELFFNINSERLAQLDTVWLVSDQSMLAFVGDMKDMTLPDYKQQPQLSTESALTPTDASDVIARKREILNSSLRVHSGRTIRRYKKALREANGDYRVLKTFYSKSGNRSMRITEDHEAFIDTIIKDYYLTPTARSIKGVHLLYKNALSNTDNLSLVGTKPLSYNPFAQRVKRLELEKIGQARGGRRLANSLAAPVKAGLRALRPIRPFQSAHIDHHLLDWYVPIAILGNRTLYARPWFTPLKDYSTSATLAYTVGFLPPSRRACAKVIRDCVRRHARLPETIVVDNGKEFSSNYFEQLLTDMGVHKQERPPEAPRFGGDIERSFGSFKSYMIDNMPGNTNNMRRGRDVSPTHKGTNYAVVSLRTLVNVLDNYLFEFYNNNISGSQLVCPSEQIRLGLEKYSCSGIRQEYDTELIIRSAIEAPRQQYTIDQSRGIRIYDRWYWSEKLLDIRDKVARDVLVEPFDSTIVYVPANGKWITCYSSKSTKVFELDSLDHMLDSIKLLEAREALRMAKEHKDDALSKLLHESLSLVEQDEATLALSKASNKQQSKQHAPVLPAYEEVTPFELVFR